MRELVMDDNGFLEGYTTKVVALLEEEGLAVVEFEDQICGSDPIMRTIFLSKGRLPFPRVVDRIRITNSPVGMPVKKGDRLLCCLINEQFDIGKWIPCPEALQAPS